MPTQSDASVNLLCTRKANLGMICDSDGTLPIWFIGLDNVDELYEPDIQKPLSSKQRKRLLIWERDKKRCFYCEKRVSLETMTIDHVVPRNLQGLNASHNLVCSCQDCNVRKGNLQVHEFIDALKSAHERLIDRVVKHYPRFAPFLKGGDA